MKSVAKPFAFPPMKCNRPKENKENKKDNQTREEVETKGQPSFLSQSWQWWVVRESAAVGGGRGRRLPNKNGNFAPIMMRPKKFCSTDSGGYKFPKTA
jgi:hypothetical protein